MAIVFLQERILNGEAQEVQDTLVLGAAPYMLTHFVPVILVKLQGFQEQQGLLVRPLTGAHGRGLVLEKTNCVTRIRLASLFSLT